MLKAKGTFPDNKHKRPKPLGNIEDIVPPKKSILKQHSEPKSRSFISSTVLSYKATDTTIKLCNIDDRWKLTTFTSLPLTAYRLTSLFTVFEKCLVKAVARLCGWLERNF